MNPRMMTGLAVVTAALLAGACGSDDPGGVTDGAAVEATIWTLEELAAEAVPDGVDVTLEYDGERISGNGGCNQYSGGATFDAGAVTIGPEIMSTLMACDEPAAGAELRYLEALPRAAAFVVNDATMTISDADGESLLVFTAKE
jgi:heat shock protein HslJ